MIFTLLIEDLVSSARLIFYFLTEAAVISTALVYGALVMHRIINGMLNS